jgi:methylmalonyl-CoA mutase N-terminal domain/subunit
VPKWNTISVSGYHIREAGATALQELAFTLRDGLEYVQWASTRARRGRFVPRSRSSSTPTATSSRRSRSIRAPGRSGAEAMRGRFGAKNERSWKLRFHSQTAGVSLTAQQPYNNVVRTALAGALGVLGGTNSLHTNSLDEALALPTAEAATLALRTQQIIATRAASPTSSIRWAGSYFVEKLTKDMEDGALAYFDPIDRMGGMVDGHRARLPAAGNRRELVTASSRRSSARTRSWSASMRSSRRTKPAD